MIVCNADGYESGLDVIVEHDDDIVTTIVVAVIFTIWFCVVVIGGDAILLGELQVIRLHIHQFVDRILAQAVSQFGVDEAERGKITFGRSARGN